MQEGSSWSSLQLVTNVDNLLEKSLCLAFPKEWVVSFHECQMVTLSLVMKLFWLLNQITNEAVNWKVTQISARGLCLFLEKELCLLFYSDRNLHLVFMWNVFNLTCLGAIKWTGELTFGDADIGGKQQEFTESTYRSSETKQEQVKENKKRTWLEAIKYNKLKYTVFIWNTISCIAYLEIDSAFSMKIMYWL